MIELVQRNGGTGFPGKLFGLSRRLRGMTHGAEFNCENDPLRPEDWPW